MKSLRAQLLLFWALLLGVFLSLGLLMASLYRSSAGSRVEAIRAEAEAACHAIAARYAKSIPSPREATPQVDLLQVLLQLVLIEAPQVEGGAWQERNGMLAYAYPTYQGSGVKRDVPAAELPLITELVQQAARSQQTRTDVVRGTREALVVSACPLASPSPDLAAWTMTRTFSGTLDAQASLRAGLGVLTLAVVASGLWLGLILRRGLQHVEKLNTAISEAADDAMPDLERTGLRELDRIVESFNRFRVRFEDTRVRLQDAEQRRGRDQRLAALGRMTGGIAHEIRNPIGAMRLKAENALAAAPERHPEALRAIVTQIDRLDELVRNLIALVQPISLVTREVELDPWLQERLQAIAIRASQKAISLTVQRSGEESALFDPVHLARAVDNLLDNAVRHTPSGGSVVMNVAAVASHALIIRVDDTGPGVAELLRVRLFEPFATGRADGTGLGLALAREVALAHGGDVRYLSLEPGTRFEMELPWRTS